MNTLHPKILTVNGKRQFAVLPYEEYNQVMEELDDYENLKCLRQAKAKEKKAPGIPLEALKKKLGIQT
ncbi:MAG: type II toxin-antitoxin system Phd/YefM family antitoxin [Planctomycetota bacterium]